MPPTQHVLFYKLFILLPTQHVFFYKLWPHSLHSDLEYKPAWERLQNKVHSHWTFDLVPFKGKLALFSFQRQEN
jgi:hypothetical protein